MLANENGVNTFHDTYISWSTLRRGRLHRIQSCTKTRKNAFRRNHTTPGSGISPPNGPCQPPRKSIVTRALMRNISAYSARKKKANFIPEYSVWYPATISDSASGISKGVRFTSAREAIKVMIIATKVKGFFNGNPNQFQNPPS